jgi:hypothetical protein
MVREIIDCRSAMRAGPASSAIDMESNLGLCYHNVPEKAVFRRENHES